MPAALDRQARIELTAVAATGLLYLFFSEVLHALGVFIVLAMTGWIGYVIGQVRRDPRVLDRWGLRRTHFGPAMRATSLVGGLALLIMAAIGLARGTLLLHGHMLPLMLLYPLWGIVQQFLVQGLIAGNLARLPGRLGTPAVVTLVAALLFGLIHLRSPLLALATFGLGLVFTPIYLRWRNLWPLGLYHGWLGVPFYFWVLGRNPWRYLPL